MSIFLAFRKLMESLGLWQTEGQQKIAAIKAEIQKSEIKLKKQEDNLKDLKLNISRLQDEVLTKEAEMKASTGEIRKILEREIASLLAQFESLSGKRDIIFRNRDSLNTIIGKYQELYTALETELDADKIADLTSDLLDIQMEMREQDRAIAKLSNTRYSEPETIKNIDISAKLSEFHSASQTEAVKQETVSVPVTESSARKSDAIPESNSPQTEKTQTDPSKDILEE